MPSSRYICPRGRIVDAGNDPLYLEHSLRNEGSHNIAIVAVGDGNKAIGGRRTRALEDVVVDACSHDFVSSKFRSEAFKCRGIFVDDDYLVTVGIEQFCEC